MKRALAASGPSVLLVSLAVMAWGWAALLNVVFP